MTEPFIFIASYRVKPGHLEDARLRLREASELAHEREPQARSFHDYLDAAREHVIGVQVHSDAESMATHMTLIARHMATAWDWLELGSSTQQVLGTPRRVLTDYAWVYSLDLETYPTSIAGFTRDPVEGVPR